MEPLATEPLVVLASASPIVGELLGEKRIVVCHSATGHASGPRRMSAPTRGIERHPRSLTDPLFAAYTDATVELRASPHATASGAKSALSAVRLSSFPQGPLRAGALATTPDAFHATERPPSRRPALLHSRGGSSACRLSPRSAQGCLLPFQRGTSAPVGSPTRRQTTVARCCGGEQKRPSPAQELRPRRP